MSHQMKAFKGIPTKVIKTKAKRNLSNVQSHPIKSNQDCSVVQPKLVKCTDSPN